MNIFRIILILTVLATVIGSQECQSQWVTFTSANTSGVQANSVRKIRRDPNGNIWFATENGLFMRNSQNGTWTRYHQTANGIGSNQVNDIFISSGGTVVLATDNGISIRSGSTFNNIGVADGLPSPIVTGVSWANTSQYWVCTYGGGIARRLGNALSGYTFSIYSTATGLPTNFYRCVFRASTGQLWFGTSNHGIVERVNGDWIQHTMDDGLAGNTILDIIEDGSGTLWLACTGGLTRLVGGEWESITASEGLHSTNYFTVADMGNGEVWAGGENGIDILLNGQPVGHISSSDGLNSNAVSAICRESTDRVWAGHLELGASMKDSGIWLNMSSGRGLSSNSIYSNPVVVGDNIHFGTHGITTYDGVNWLRNGFSMSQSISQLWGTDDGRLWASGYSTYGFTFSGGWSNQTKPDNNTFGLPMLSFSNGTQWYCASDGVYRRNQWGEMTKFLSDTHLTGFRPRNIMADRHGTIWIISENGLCRYEGLQWQCYEVPDVPKDKLVLHPTSLAISPQGNPMFVAHKTKLGTTMPGFYIVELRAIVNHRLYHTLHSIDDWGNASSNIKLASDSSGGIWIAGSDLNTSTAPACIQFTSSGEVHRHYRTDGIASNMIRGMLDDGNGYMWLTTDAGVSRAPLLALSSHETVSIPSTGSSMSVYPNPSRDFFTIELKSNHAVDELVVTDMKGSEILRLPISLTPYQNSRVHLDLGMLPRGMFLLTPSKSPELTTRIVIN